MKKALSITGRVELTRQEITKAIASFLIQTEQLTLEKVIYEVKSDNLEGAVVYVHQAHTDDVPKFELPKKEKHVFTKKFTRPNRGVGELLHDILNDGLTHSFNEIAEDVSRDFPKCTTNQLRRYLRREKMVGFRVFYIKHSDEYQKYEVYVKSNVLK